MRAGLEVLLSDRKDIMAEKSIGLVVNQTAVDSQLVHAIELFRQDSELNLVRLFGPEHGVRGDAQDMISVDHQVDSHTGLKVISLYGHDEESLRPRTRDLLGLDLLVFDIQDIGSRYYTFVYTMAYCMEAAGEFGIPIVVCDRPNPLNGEALEGGILDLEYRSFVGRYPLPVRHGMTAGELAIFFRDVCHVQCDLTVIPVDGWCRSQFYDETGLPWVQPSPNMPTPETALVYPGACLLEATNVSEGRGTTRPFHVAGAPWVNAFVLADRLNLENLPGLRWRPTFFTPMFHKFKGVQCAGVELHVQERKTFKPLLSGIALVKNLRALHPEYFRWRTEPYEFVTHRLAIDLLGGGATLRHQIEMNLALSEIEASWNLSQSQFLTQRQACLLYP